MYLRVDSFRFVSSTMRQSANGRSHGISCLFMQPKLIEGLLHFLEETGACAKPRTEWEPGRGKRGDTKEKPVAEGDQCCL